MNIGLLDIDGHGFPNIALMKTHLLKTKSEYFNQVQLGVKKFELRENDRNFKVGDKITLLEIDENKITTGKKITDLEIKYILHGGCFGLSPRYCIINW